MAYNAIGRHRFNAAERASETDLFRQGDYFTADQITRHILDNVPSLLAILNRQRQIIFANRQLCSLIGVKDVDSLLGQRPGEALSCIHSDTSVDGCGGGEACGSCGAALALLAGELNRTEARECRILRFDSGRTEALDMEVWATPFEFHGEELTLFALTDVSHQKRQSIMEKLFFHDVLNVVGSIRGFSEVLTNYEPEDRQQIYSLIHLASQQVIDQIQAYRMLAAAERGELKARKEPISCHGFVREMADLYRGHDVTADRNLKVLTPTEDVCFHSDRTMLVRIVGNMLINAFEAVESGAEVALGVDCRAGRVRFWVENPGVIPRDIQVQIFQRSFSTKGTGRGLGTYSQRLLSELLGGQVQFVSNEQVGTRFEASFPLA